MQKMTQTATSRAIIRAHTSAKAPKIQNLKPYPGKIENTNHAPFGIVLKNLNTSHFAVAYHSLDGHLSQLYAQPLYTIN